MRIFYYVLTVLFGAFGLLALGRAIEVSGATRNPQLLFGVIGLVLAVFFLQRARAS